MDYSQITPEMAQAELARRQNANNVPQQVTEYSSITPEMARAELARRQENVPRRTEELVPPDNRNFLQKAGDFAQTYVNDPVEAAAYGLERGLGNLAALPASLVDKLAGTNLTKEIRGEQASRKQAFEKRFGDALLPKAAAFVGEEIPAWAPGIGMGSKAVKGIAALSKTPLRKAMAENAIAGGIAGGIQAPDEERLKGALIGTGLGAGAGVVGRGIDKALLQPAAKWYAQSAIPGMIEKAGSFIKDLPSAAFGSRALKQRFTSAAEKNTANWTKTQTLANQLDDQLGTSAQYLGTGFNASPYIKYADDYISKIESFTPAKKAQYQEALEFAREARNLAPKNFEDVMLLRQNLNQFLGDFTKKRGLEKADRFAQDFVKGIKENLVNDTFKANARLVDPKTFSQFEKTWQSANKSHQEVQEFFKGIGKTGALKPKQVLREGLQNNPEIEASIISEYMPKPSQTGITGFKQLEKVMGSKEATQQAVKSYLTRQLRENGATSQNISSLYAKFSPEQRKYIFGGSKEEDYLKAINEAMLKVGKPESAHGLRALGHHVIGLGIPGALGFYGAEEAGLPFRESLGVGIASALGAKGAKALISKTATPKLLEKAANLAEKGRARPGYLTNLLLQNSPLQGMGAQ